MLCDLFQKIRDGRVTMVELLSPGKVAREWRVIARIDGEFFEIARREKREDAQTIRDNIARQCNEARSAPSRPGD